MGRAEGCFLIALANLSVRIERAQGCRLTPVKEAINPLGEGLADAIHRGDIGELGFRDTFGGAEPVEQRLLARRANALNLIQWVFQNTLIKVRIKVSLGKI